MANDIEILDHVLDDSRREKNTDIRDIAWVYLGEILRERFVERVIPSGEIETIAEDLLKKVAVDCSRERTDED